MSEVNASRTLLLASTASVVVFLIGGLLFSQEGPPNDAAPTSEPSSNEPLAETQSRFDHCLSEYAKGEGPAGPETGGVLFVGSSSVRAWGTMGRDLPGHRVLNRGCGGAMLPELNGRIESLVERYRPSAVIVYAGENDLVAGRSAEEISGGAKKFYDIVQRTQLSTPVLFLSIKPSIARFANLDEMERANVSIRGLASSRENFRYVDVTTPLLNEKRLPRSDYYTEDGLHLTLNAYRIWGKRISDILDELARESRTRVSRR